MKKFGSFIVSVSLALWIPAQSAASPENIKDTSVADLQRTIQNFQNQMYQMNNQIKIINSRLNELKKNSVQINNSKKKTEEKIGGRILISENFTIGKEELKSTSASCPPSHPNIVTGGCEGYWKVRIVSSYPEIIGNGRPDQWHCIFNNNMKKEGDFSISVRAICSQN